MCSIMLSACTQAFSSNDQIDFPLFAAAVDLCSMILSAPCHRALVTPGAQLQQRLLDGSSHFAFFLACDNVASDRLQELLRLVERGCLRVVA